MHTVVSTHILLVRTKSHGQQGRLGNVGWLGAWEDEQNRFEGLTSNYCHGELEEEIHTAVTMFVYLFVSSLQKAKALGSSKALLC